MASRADVARFRTTQRQVATLATRDLAAAWAGLDLSKPEAARDALLRYTPALAARYGDVSATLAADWYDDLRAREVVDRGRRFAAVMADPVASERVAGSVRFAASHLFTDAPSMTLDVLSGALERFALQPGRDTVVLSSRADPNASGWYRISGGGCDFCDMLAERGAVYREETVDFAAHDHCRCGVVPSWDPTRPEADVRQYEASARTSAMTEEQRAEHNARVRDYLAERREAIKAATP